MARRSSSTELGLVALTIEGGLIAPEQVQKVIATDRTAKTAESYGCPKGTSLGDEIARYFRIGQAIWRDYDQAGAKTIARTASFARDLLSQCFGFSDLAGPHEHRQGSRRYRIAWESKGGRVPVVVAAPVDSGDAFAKSQAEFGDGEGGRPRRSPAALLQDWLNANPSFYWGLVFAGDRVRLMRDNARLTRPAWIEADLGAMFRDEMFADFTAFWLLAHSSRFGAQGAAASDCALEQWREAGLKRGVEARKDLYANVATALEQLGQGLADANPDLRERMHNETGFTQSLFQELLRTVYRLIFLAVAEDRDLLHPRRTPREARQLYAAGYSFSFWRERSRRKVARDSHHDAWEAMKVTFAALEQGEEMLGLPALGGLFAQGSTRHLNAAILPNRAFLEALFKLGFIERDRVTHRINWRDLKTEELGSVYEGLLEIRPSLTVAGDFQLGSGAKGNDRKTSGSYYTPDSLVECLLDSALDPVLDRAEAGGATPEDKIAAILDLKVIDPACGSGHFLLGAARRMADRVARLRNEDAGKEETQAALRDVVSRCIHGVDRNPMAVELAKVALWIESVSPGQPLGFLDANIRCGDALLGVFDLAVLEDGIPDEAYKPLTGDDKTAAKFYLKLNRDAKKGQGQLDFAGGGGIMPAKPIAVGLGRIKAMPEDTVGQVEKKRQAFEAWKADPARYATEVACDLYMAAFLSPKTEVPASNLRPIVPTTADVRQKLAGGNVYGPLEGEARDVAATARVLHWPLEFPDVMVGKGGFDVVLGNPPWEVVQLGEQEYFESKVPEVAELKGAARKVAIANLAHDRPDIFKGYILDKRAFESANEFARGSGRFPLVANNKINTYQLFAELSDKMRNEYGNVGLVLPTGIATSDGCKTFFADILKRQQLISVFAFYEIRYWFEGTDDKNSFCLISLGNNENDPEFVFDAQPISDLQDPNRRYRLGIDQIAALNPDSLTAPIFRARGDAHISVKLYAPLQEGLRPLVWLSLRQNVFSSSLADDLTEFAIPRNDHANPVPVYRGASIHQYDSQYSSFDGEAFQKVDESASFGDGIIDSDKYVSGRFFKERMRSKGLNTAYNLVIRRIARASDDRTMIAAIIPGVAMDDTLSVVDTQLGAEIRSAILANLNSLVLDFACGHKIAGPDIRKHNFSQLPILPPNAYDEAALAFIVPRVLELTYTSHSMAPFARDLGYGGPPFAWDEDRRAQLRAELDAWYALAYGLSRDELRYVLDPKDVMGADYPSETFRVLQKNEIAKYGEYRTRRLVLAAYDALIAQGLRPRTEGYR